MIPSKTYRFVLKKGMQGHDVWALQINLNNWGFQLTEDGVFGDKTLEAVSNYQDIKGLAIDGIAGVVTQRNLAIALITKYQLGVPPQGLVKGLVEGESGFLVGAVNWSVPGGVDCGWVQRRVYEPYTATSPFHDAFSGKVQFGLLGASLRERKTKFLGMPGAPTDRRAWELATLYHNWPAGATDLANGKQLSTQPAQWVINIGVQRVTTPAQWAEYYIDTKTIYVTNWTT